jgi:HK97 family phage major capsid protein
MPSWDEIIRAQADKIVVKRAEKKTHDDVIENVRAACLAEARDPSDAEAARVSVARAASTMLSAEIEVLEATRSDLEVERAKDDAVDKLAREKNAPAYDQVGRVQSEPRTYTQRASLKGEARFFQDAWNAQRGNFEARERIERHGREVSIEGEMTSRALATGGIAGLTVPQYLIELAAPIIRAGRPLANVLNRHQIPDEGMSLIIPRGTTGASAAIQATENSAVSSTDEVWSNLTVPVATIAGQQQVSRQSLERGEGVDEIIFMDLARAHGAQVDNMVINGSGSSGQPLGILNTVGIGAATAFAAAPSAANVSLKIAGAIYNVTSTGAGIFPKVLVMHPRRWGYLTGLVDSSNRPIVTAQQLGPWNAASLITAPGGYGGDPNQDLNGATFVGIHNSGLPVITDLNIPSTVGTNSEDVVLALDTHELHLWEDGDGLPRQLSFEQTSGNNLTTTLVVYSYIAFTAGRYPGASAKVGGLDTVAGQGLVAPSF